jgi:hypothetical protein
MTTGHRPKAGKGYDNDDDDDVTASDYQALDRHIKALYELRLTELGPKDDEDFRNARLWASAVLGEAMCVMELAFGKEVAEEMAREMLASRAAYTGPRTRRARH